MQGPVERERGVGDDQEPDPGAVGGRERVGPRVPAEHQRAVGGGREAATESTLGSPSRAAAVCRGTHRGSEVRSSTRTALPGVVEAPAAAPSPSASCHSSQLSAASPVDATSSTSPQRRTVVTTSEAAGTSSTTRVGGGDEHLLRRPGLPQVEGEGREVLREQVLRVRIRDASQLSV